MAKRPRPGDVTWTPEMELDRQEYMRSSRQHQSRPADTPKTPPAEAQLDDMAEARRRILHALNTGAASLNLSRLNIDTLMEAVWGIRSLEHVDINGTSISDLTPLAGLERLEYLFLGGTKVSDLSPLQNLVSLHTLDFDETPVADLTPLTDCQSLQDLNLGNTNVSDLSPLANLTKLRRLYLAGTQITDLRPVLTLPVLTARESPETQGRSISFENTPACEDPAIAAAAEIEDDEARLQALLAHLHTLPPWPAPLPQDIPPVPQSAGDTPAPEQDPTLPLIWGEGGFDFFAAQTRRDPVLDASLEELRDLLEVLKRKGNQHDDLRARALKALALLDTDTPDALKLHLQYQALLRMRAGADTRTDPFDDETLSAMDTLRDVVPGITLSHQAVQDLIDRQEQDRTASATGITPAREVALLHRVAEEGAPFAPAVQDAAIMAADPEATDRPSGLRKVLSRNAMIATLKWGGVTVAGAIVGGAAWDGLKWAVAHQDTLTSLAHSMGDDIYWWARNILDKIRAALEARSPGP